MTSLRVEGPDASRLLNDLSVNGFADFDVDRTKRVVMCNPNGHVIGDGPLLRLGEQEFYGPGVLSANWVRYNVETDDYDVTIETEPHTSALDGESPVETAWRISVVRGPQRII